MRCWWCRRPLHSHEVLITPPFHKKRGEFGEETTKTISDEEINETWEPQWAIWEQTDLRVAHGNICLKGLGTTMIMIQKRLSLIPLQLLWLGKTDKKADCPQHSTLPSRLNLSVAWKPWWSNFTVMIKLEKDCPQHSTSQTHLDLCAAWKTWRSSPRGDRPQFHLNISVAWKNWQESRLSTALHSTVTLEPLCGVETLMIKLYCDDQAWKDCPQHSTLPSRLNLSVVWKPWWLSFTVMIKLEKTVHSTPLYRHAWTSLWCGNLDD